MVMRYEAKAGVGEVVRVMSLIIDNSAMDNLLSMPLTRPSLATTVTDTANVRSAQVLLLLPPSIRIYHLPCTPSPFYDFTHQNVIQFKIDDRGPHVASRIIDIISQDPAQVSLLNFPFFSSSFLPFYLCSALLILNSTFLLCACRSWI